MVVFGRVAAAWFDHPDQDLDKLVCDTFEDLGALAAPLAADRESALED